MTKRILFILVGAIVVVLVLVGVGIFVLLPKVTSANSPTATSTSSTTTKTKVKTEAAIIKEYTPDIRDNMAQGLHLTPEQLTNDLRSGQTLNQIATTQGVSNTQLQTLISTSVTTGLQPAVTAGTLTQTQVNNLVKRYEKNHTPLEKLLSVLTKTKTKKTATPTPTAAQ